MPQATHAVFPGTFDPVTNGHLDVVRRSAAVFEKLTVAVAVHPEKRGLFATDERLELLREATADVRGVEVASIEGLLVDACRALGARVVVRGVRSGTDFDYEVQMARTNRALWNELETFLVAPAPEVAHVSSTLVRQIAAMGGDVSAFVPRCVADALDRRRSGGER